MAGRPRRQGGSNSRCPACGAPVLTQLVGRIAALTVTTDLTPLTPEEQAQARAPNRLVWCLHHPAIGPPRLRWTDTHPPDCPHPHVAEHRCQPPARLF